MRKKDNKSGRSEDDPKPVQLELPWGKPVLQGNFDGDETCPRCRRTLVKQGCYFCFCPNCGYTSCGVD